MLGAVQWKCVRLFFVVVVTHFAFGILIRWVLLLLLLLIQHKQPPHTVLPLQVSPLRYTGRVVMVRDHFGFIQCQDLPTEADAVSRWSHKSPSDEGEAEPTPNGKHDAAKRKKKLGNRFQIFFSLAEVEGESELKGGDEVEFVLGMQKGDRVARRVRFKSRPAPLPEPSVTPLGERRKLFVDVCVAGFVLLDDVLIVLCHLTSTF